MYGNKTSQLNRAADAGYIGSANPIGASPESSVSLMDQSVKEAFEALGALGASVDWLLSKIEPVCQEQRTGNTEGDSKAGEVQAMPSSLRGDLIKLRIEAERISARISSVRYTIEI